MRIATMGTTRQMTATGRTLTLALKGEYFDAIASGTKCEEFRLATPHWRKRLEDRRYDHVVLTRGYPATGDSSRRIQRPWLGCRKAWILHPHFGPEPVLAYAIRVAPGANPPGRREAGPDGPRLVETPAI